MNYSPTGPVVWLLRDVETWLITNRPRYRTKLCWNQEGDGRRTLGVARSHL